MNFGRDKNVRDVRLTCPDCGSDDVIEMGEWNCKCRACLTVSARIAFTPGNNTDFYEPVAEVGDTVRVEWTVLWVWTRSEELVVDKVCEDGVYEKRDGLGWRFVPHWAFYEGDWMVIEE